MPKSIRISQFCAKNTQDIYFLILCLELKKSVCQIPKTTSEINRPYEASNVKFTYLSKPRQVLTFSSLLGPFSTATTEAMKAVGTLLRLLRVVLEVVGATLPLHIGDFIQLLSSGIFFFKNRFYWSFLILYE